MGCEKAERHDTAFQCGFASYEAVLAVHTVVLPAASKVLGFGVHDGGMYDVCTQHALQTCVTRIPSCGFRSVYHETGLYTEHKRCRSEYCLRRLIQLQLFHPSQNCWLNKPLR